MRCAVRLSVAAAFVLSTLSATPKAYAVDVGQLGGERVALDVTETSILSQRFDARDQERFEDSGWGQWVNRVNASLRWKTWTGGLRLDSAVYFRRPIDRPDFGAQPLGRQNEVATDNESRFGSSLYPAKAWVTYASPGVELTVGDAYAQFGRGLTLSLRKVDELGIDTTARGVKLEVQKDPFALTAIVGFGNPSRVDEASGRTLFATHDLVQGDPTLASFGSDRIAGLEVQAGRGLPVTLSTHATNFTRCAPYRYDAGGSVVTAFGDDPSGVTFGTCNPDDRARWLQQIGNVPTPLGASSITMVGQSIEVPSLWGHGKLYLEAAAQTRRHDSAAQNDNGDGNALYGALSLDAGPMATTLEVKSNRNFYVVPASIDPNRAGEFSVVAYSFLPPAETFDMVDTEGTGNFNACVDGGRLRVDMNATRDLMVYSQGIYAVTRSEQSNGACNKSGRAISAVAANKVQDTVWDGIAGAEWYFDGALSHVFVRAGARDDVRGDGNWNYREQHVAYSVVKYLGGAWSIEVQGRHRHRREDGQNAREWWGEGEDYLALKMAPRWVWTGGFEYTTVAGQPAYYANGSVLCKLTSGSNVRLFVGQQRGAFRCASGICRYFPPFEGARAELTLRF